MHFNRFDFLLQVASMKFAGYQVGYSLWGKHLICLLSYPLNLLLKILSLILNIILIICLYKKRFTCKFSNIASSSSVHTYTKEKFFFRHYSYLCRLFRYLVGDKHANIPSHCQ